MIYKGRTIYGQLTAIYTHSRRELRSHNKTILKWFHRSMPLGYFGTTWILFCGHKCDTHMDCSNKSHENSLFCKLDPLARIPSWTRQFPRRIFNFKFPPLAAAAVYIDLLTWYFRI